MSKPPIELMLDGVQWVENTFPPNHEENIPWATHEGVLEILGTKLRCYRLSTGQAVFNADDINALFGVVE